MGQQFILIYCPSDHIQATARKPVCTVSPIQTTHHSVTTYSPDI